MSKSTPAAINSTVSAPIPAGSSCRQTRSESPRPCLRSRPRRFSQGSRIPVLEGPPIPLPPLKVSKLLLVRIPFLTLSDSLPAMMFTGWTPLRYMLHHRLIPQKLMHLHLRILRESSYEGASRSATSHMSRRTLHHIPILHPTSKLPLLISAHHAPRFLLPNAPQSFLTHIKVSRRSTIGGHKPFVDIP